jgi:hypothetical protein
MRPNPLWRLLTLAVGLATVASACAPAAGTPKDLHSDLSASLSEVQGTVEIKNPDQAEFAPAADGLEIEVRGQVRTGADGRLRLDLSTGGIVRVAANSLFNLQANEIQADGPFTRLAVGAGQVWVMLHGGRMEVETPSGVASVRGSYMSVWVDPLTQDVWVTCLEGWCQAENPTQSMDMLAGQGAVLYNWDPVGNLPPPPPRLRALTQQDIDQFMTVNPEAQEVMASMAATAVLLPTMTPAASPTPVASCFELTSPSDEAELAAEGQLTFDWTGLAEAYKYIITFTKPNGAEKSQIAWSSAFQIDAAGLPLAGTYQWQVTAYDSNIQPICTAGPWTFTKAAAPAPAQVADCFHLTAPASGEELSSSGSVTFAWSEQPERYKYILDVTKPDGSEISLISWANSYVKDLTLLPDGGTYQWQVTAYDSNIQPICTAGPWTFSKPASSAPAPSGDCFQLTSPADGTELPASGPLTFAWTEYPTRFKYILRLLKPDGTETSEIVWSNALVRDTSSLSAEGTYQWQVTAYDSNIQPICTAGPWTFSKPASSAPPSSPAGECVTLLTPADGTDFPTPAGVEFTWTAHPQAYKYIITFKPPSTPASNFLAWTPSHLRYVESFVEGGTYKWWVTVKNQDLQDVCTSAAFTFTKPTTVLPTPKPSSGGGGGGGDLFWNRSVSLSGCSVYASADTSYAGGVKKVTLSKSPNPPETPYIALSGMGGSMYGASFDLRDLVSSAPAGTTLYWRFEIFDGSYKLDAYVGSLTTGVDCTK